MPLIDNFRHRPEIDGLRAVAVSAVALGHAGLSCTGGYIGVDVFFVISGFLITSLIWKDLESGKFTFANFWERRVRRIVPAMVVVTVAVIVAGWFILTPVDFKTLGNATKAQALFAANFHYWRDTGYFAGAAEEKPLLHTWSLAVEEQFYLIVPFLLWGMYRFEKLRTRGAVIGVLGFGFVVSFALSIVGVKREPSMTFYLLPARAWELLAGSLIAFASTSPRVLAKSAVRNIVSLAGLAMILVPIFAYTPATPFPGAAAVPPVLGTVLIIWSNGPGLTAVGSLLSTPPFLFVGLISYSLYLWHWPFLAFSRYQALEPLTINHRLTLLGFGFAAAILSWRFVESPFRTRTLGSTRMAMFRYAGAGLVGVLAIGIVCSAMKGFPRRFSPQALEYANAITDTEPETQLELEDARAGKLFNVGVVDPALRPTLLVWGDSHAMSALPAIDAFLREKGLSGRAATHSSTPPILDWFVRLKWGLSEQSIPYNEAVFTYAQKEKIPHLLLIANWSDYNVGHDVDPAAFNASLVNTVKRIAASGAQPWIMLDVPSHPFNVPTALSRAIYPSSQAYLTSLCSKPAERDELAATDPKLLTDIESAGGRILNPKPRFLDPTGSHYIIQSDGIALYRDMNHLTTRGAKLMLVPLFRESLLLNHP